MRRQGAKIALISSFQPQGFLASPEEAAPYIKYASLMKSAGADF
jgi:hypothetical protein